MENFIVGNIAYWTNDSLETAFGNDSVVLSGAKCSMGGKKRTVFEFQPLDWQFERIFLNFNFDRVVFMSQYLTFQGNRQDELESLHRVLSLCRKSHIGEVIYIVSQDVCRDEGSDAILLRAAEELCTYSREKNWVPVTVIRCPYLIGGNVPSDYWYQVFQGLEEKGSWVFRTRPEELADFVDMADIAEFLRRLFDEGIHNNQVLELHGSRSLTFQEVAQWLKEQYPYADIRFEGWKSWDPPELGENQARSKLGWFPKVSMAESL